MKVNKFFKTIVITAMLATSVVMAGCDGDNKPQQTEWEEIEQAVNAAVDFLEAARDGCNYLSVSEYTSDTYEYYVEGDKIKVEYNDELFYGVIEDGELYKIVQSDDGTWRATDDVTDLFEPSYRIGNLIKSIERTTTLLLWTDYNAKTKTLTAVYADGSGTLTLDAGTFIWAITDDNGNTATHTISNVGDTVVTLPENAVE